MTCEGNVFRGTNVHKGRRMVITPANSSMEHLCYARIVLDASMLQAGFDTEDRDTGLICLSGEVDVEAGGEQFTLTRHDAAYIPRASVVRLATRSAADLAEFSAAVNG